MMIFITADAAGDLDELNAYYRSNGDVSAVHDYMLDLSQAIADLATLPERFPVQPRIAPRARVMVFRRRVTVVYRIDDDRVNVLGVFGAGRRIIL